MQFLSESVRKILHTPKLEDKFCVLSIIICHFLTLAKKVAINMRFKEETTTSVLCDKIKNKLQLEILKVLWKPLALYNARQKKNPVKDEVSFKKNVNISAFFKSNEWTITLLQRTHVWIY